MTIERLRQFGPARVPSTEPDRAHGTREGRGGGSARPHGPHPRGPPEPSAGPGSARQPAGAGAGLVAVSEFTTPDAAYTTELSTSPCGQFRVRFSRSRGLSFFMTLAGLRGRCTPPGAATTVSVWSTADVAGS